MADFPESKIRCWAEIDLDALRHNARLTTEMVAPAGLLAIVKADAYGHSAELVVPVLEDYVELFGVANIGEAKRLPTTKPVLLLSPCLPAEREQVVEYGLIPSLSTMAEIDGFAAAAAAAGKTLDVHLKIDTGMGRIGFLPDQIATAVQHANALSVLKVTALATHLPVADEDKQFTSRQLEEFSQLIKQLRRDFPRMPAIHCLNSAGIIDFPASAEDLVRPGLQLYGVNPFPEGDNNLHPVMSVRTRVTLVRELPAGHGVSYGRTFITTEPTKVATLAIGYADGYPRSLSGKGAYVLIHGQPCPLLGRVTMDQIMVDVTALEQVQAGDVATVLGSDGNHSIAAWSLAKLADTIPWEILTGIQQRVIRCATAA